MPIPAHLPVQQAMAAPPAGAPAGGGAGEAVLERVPQKIKPPAMYQVVMLNDDYTPMEFVVRVLQEFFAKDEASAMQIMLRIHNEGRGVCGVYSRDVAATKAGQVLDAARHDGHPLQCVIEPLP